MEENIKTTKYKEAYLCFSYLYYLKTPNKDGSMIRVCKEKSCSASITFFDEKIIKVNGTHVDDINEEMIKESHKNNHPGLTTSYIFIVKVFIV
jgi:hypothetical protein